MITRPRTEVSRRQFLVAGGFALAAACLVPRGLFAQADVLVPEAMRESATAKITVQTVAISAFSWVRVETSLFSPVLTGSSLWMPKSSPHVRMCPQRYRA